MIGNFMLVFCLTKPVIKTTGKLGEIREKIDCGATYFHNFITSSCFSSQWFCESTALDTDDSLEKQKVFKFRGDLALRQGNYQVTGVLQFSFTQVCISLQSLQNSTAAGTEICV